MNRITPRNSSRTTSSEGTKLKEANIMSMNFIIPELTMFCGIEETVRARIMGDISIGNQRGSGHMREFQAAMNILIENDIPRKGILAGRVTNVPTNMIIFIPKIGRASCRERVCLAV